VYPLSFAKRAHATEKMGDGEALLEKEWEGVCKCKKAFCSVREILQSLAQRTGQCGEDVLALEFLRRDWKTRGGVVGQGRVVPGIGRGA